MPGTAAASRLLLGSVNQTWLWEHFLKKIICNICSICEINKLVNPRENLWDLVPKVYGIWKEMNKAFEWKPVA